MEMNQFYAHSCVRLCVLKEGSAAQICAPGFTGQMHKMNIKLKLKLKLPLRHSGIHWKKAEKTDSEAVRKSERQHPVPQGRAFLFPPLLQIHFGFLAKSCVNFLMLNLSLQLPNGVTRMQAMPRFTRVAPKNCHHCALDSLRN